MADLEVVRDALTADALNSLVHQFSDPLCFFRELVQNALDAGAREVVVTLAQEDDACTITVQDHGEGMTREIIDTELTRLFTSHKENDMTKIGKFGVGFVSVFAIEPQAVVVDTSRDGESWRVLFHPDRSFTRIRIETPVGGTRVRLIKAMPADSFPEFVRRSEEVLRYWCKYSEADIRFQGRPIDQPFDLDSPVKVRYTHGNTEVVAALTTSVVPFFGLYNRGLTLVEGRQLFYPHVMFRIKSNYLEHTISRDNVIEDEGFQKALRIVRDAVHEMLYPELFRRIEAGETALMRYLPEILRDAARRPKDMLSRPFFETVSGRRLRACDLQFLHWRHGALYYSSMADDEVAARLSARGVAVLRSGEDVDALAATVRAVVGESPRQANRAFYLAIPAPVPKADRTMRRFLHAIRYLMGMRTHVHVADLGYAGSTVADEPAIFARKLGVPLPLPPPRPPFEDARDHRHLVLNSRHPLMADALAAAAHDGLLAAHIVVRLLALHGVAPQQPPEMLLARAVRWRREWPWQRLLRRYRGQ